MKAFAVSVTLILAACAKHLPPVQSQPDQVQFCSTYVDVWPGDACIGLVTKDDFQCTICHSKDSNIEGCVPKDLMIYCNIGKCGEDTACIRQ